MTYLGGMIKFTLSCENDHRFESWFASNAACDKLMSTGMVTCTTCGSADIHKTLMAPSVPKKTNAATPDPIEKLRQEVETNSEYVGGSFATQARDMHDGLIDEKPIYGEATGADAIKLIDDGVPIMPLPFIPKKKVN